ncbi:MAG: thioredoxin [Actinobacteria bacterium]|nr:MAG: thioredoxin [Actinomycetota bacterium]
MAKQSVPDDSVRAKALQMRHDQERADRRARIVIFSIVAVVVVAVVAAVGIVISQQLQQRNDVVNTDTADATSVLGVYADGSPIVVSHLGVGKADDSLPTLTEYFDYSCHACADAEVFVGKDIFAGVKEGKYNLAYQPVNTVQMPFQYAATTASLVVAQKAPEQWPAFHHSLMEYFAQQFNSGQGTVIRDLPKSAAQVKLIAAEVGVPDSVIESFPENASDTYLKVASEKWGNGNFEGRSSSGIGTPEFVANGKKRIIFEASEPAAIVATIEKELANTK